MNRKKQAYIVIGVAIILLIMSIRDLNFDNLSEGPFSGIVGTLLLILSMIVTIRDIVRKEESVEKQKLIHNNNLNQIKYKTEIIEL